MRREQIHRRPSDERRLPREQFVGQHPEGIDVRAMIHGGIGARLLRRHVGRRADGHAQRRHAAAARGARRAQGLGDAEVRDHRAPAREQHVVGLDVAMHDAVVVRIRQRTGDLAQDADRVAHRQFAMALQPDAQRLALHERHREIRQTVRLARRMQWHDVRMLQPRGEQDLALEPFQRHLRRGLRRQHLDHDRAAERDLLGHEHA